MILRFMDGPRSGKTIKINRDDFTIGRDDSCDLLLDEDGVSRLHCRIERKDETYTLKDNDSTNGIRINGAKVNGSQELKQNDTIRISDVLLLFSSDENKLDSKVVESLASGRDEKESLVKADPSAESSSSDGKDAEVAKEADDPKDETDSEKSVEEGVGDETSKSQTPDPGETQDHKPEAEEPGEVKLNFDKKKSELKDDNESDDGSSPFGGSTGIMIAIVALLLIILLWLIFNPK